MKDIYDALMPKVMDHAANNNQNSIIQYIFKNVMEHIDARSKIEKIDGDEKQQMAINISKNILQELGQNGIISAKKSKSMQKAVDEIAPGLIDLTVAASKGLVALIHAGCCKCM